MTSVWKADEILPGLFLGQSRDGENYHELKKRNVTHILPVMDFYLRPFSTRDFKYKEVTARDCETENLKPKFEECHAFIDEGRSTGSVLVHCGAGISRSPTIVISYVMKKEGMTLEQAFNFVRKARNFIDPNDGFMDQLKSYEKELFAGNTNRNEKGE
eukprot:TRINITY_DN11165_c0_g1_i1.p1 TRINITY_DN11165_c0_g1~~TRINITY_DN11165_c0_g1_i1.p1  ORF type:complete len:158 (-),score=28.46 TRINITY_DN11165_c0_g1_i1:8-481(-)